MVTTRMGRWVWGIENPKVSPASPLTPRRDPKGLFLAHVGENKTPDRPLQLDGLGLLVRERTREDSREVLQGESDLLPHQTFLERVMGIRGNF